MPPAQTLDQLQLRETPLSKLAGGAESDFRALLARCTLTPDEVIGHTLARRALTGFLQFFAILTAAATDGSWHAAPDHPGYVTFSGSVQVMVPYHIAPHFPVGTELAAFAALARAVRVGSGSSGSTICLSGSAAMLGMILHQGDIDFCEYLHWLEASDDAARSIADHCETISEDLACLATRVAAYKWQAGETAPCNPKDIVHALQAAKPRNRRGKMDYIASLGIQEAAEASNILIWLDPEAGFDARTMSFSQQEAAIAADGWMPRRLDEPVEIGTYITFLLSQIDHYLDISPVKAAKRALSLAFLFHFGAAAEALTDVLSECSLTADDAARQRRASAERVVAVLGPRGQVFADQARASSSRLDPGLATDMRDTALKTVRGHIQIIRKAVDAQLALCRRLNQDLPS